MRWFALMIAALMGCRSLPEREAPSTSGPTEPPAEQRKLSRPIFRLISIGKGLVIELGVVISPNVVPLLDPQTPTKYRIRDGHFGGAEAIGVETTEAGIVRMFVFAYGRRKDFQAQLLAYVKLLGEPTSWSWTDGRRVATWDDALTVFELINDADGTIATLSDKSATKR